MAMRIAFIVGTFPQLSETFILNQVTGLLEMGQDVEIFEWGGCTGQGTHPVIGEYNLIERVRCFSMPLKKSSRIAGALKLVCRQGGGNRCRMLRALNAARYGREALSLRCLYALAAFLNSDFDIIHCHFGTNGIMGAVLKELGVKGRLVTSFYGHDLSAFLEGGGAPAYGRLFARGDLFLPVSDYFRKKLIGLGCDEKKTVTHHLGVDPSQLTGAVRGGNGIKVLTVGRLVEKKGHEYALRAIAELAPRHGSLEYIIAGDGPLRAGLEALAGELGLGDRVQFLGKVTPERAARLYAECDLFLLPSVKAANGDEEGTPTVLCEAQASYLPVVSTHHSGIPEVVLDGRSGLLVPERDAGALAEQMELLIRDPARRMEMGKRGRALIEEQYDVRKLNRRLVELYGKVLAGEAGRR